MYYTTTLLKVKMKVILALNFRNLIFINHFLLLLNLHYCWRQNFGRSSSWAFTSFVEKYSENHLWRFFFKAWKKYSTSQSDFNYFKIKGWFCWNPDRTQKLQINLNLKFYVNTIKQLASSKLQVLTIILNKQQISMPKEERKITRKGHLETRAENQGSLEKG